MSDGVTAGLVTIAVSGLLTYAWYKRRARRQQEELRELTGQAMMDLETLSARDR